MSYDCPGQASYFIFSQIVFRHNPGNLLARHAIVEELAGFGARVHTCSRNAEELEECRHRWDEKRFQVTVSVCDVSSRADREKLMETVKQNFDGKLDILVLLFSLFKLIILKKTY